MKAYGLTNVGLKRTVNQDAFYINNDERVYIVADGMGGHKAGDLASKLSLQAILEFLKEKSKADADPDDQDEEQAVASELENCRKAIKHANQIVFQRASSNSEYQGMGSTIVFLKILHGHAIIAQVGDSRIYRIQDEAIHQLTKDHSRIQELIDQERITPAEALRYPLKNVITRALGGAVEVEVDTGIVPLGRNDVFVLCTDGLSGVMDDQEILDLISANPGDPEESCNRLVQCVLDKGAPDNVTVIISDTRAYNGYGPKTPPEEPVPDEDSDKGAFRKFIDRWFKQS